MSTLVLTYFDLHGRAEPTRLALWIAGLNFEDKRLSREEFRAIKPDFPFGTVPVLEIDGTKYAQSTALLRYAGKLGGLYPEDALTALKVDEIVMASEDIGILLGTTRQEEDPEKQKELQAALARGKIKTVLEGLAAKLAANPSSDYFVGNSLTIADLQVYTCVLFLGSGHFDGIPSGLVLDITPSLQKHHQTVLDHPKVKEYYESKNARAAHTSEWLAFSGSQASLL